MSFVKNYGFIFTLTTLITPMNFSCLYSRESTESTIYDAATAFWARNSKALKQFGKELGIDNNTPKEILIFGLIAAAGKGLEKTNSSWFRDAWKFISLVYLVNKIKNSSYYKIFLKSPIITHITECEKEGCNKSCPYCQTWDALLTLASVYRIHQAEFVKTTFYVAMTVAALWVKKSKTLEQLNKKLWTDNDTPKEIIIFGLIAAISGALKQKHYRWSESSWDRIYLVYLVNKIKNSSYGQKFLKNSKITRIIECGKEGCNKSCTYCQTWNTLLTLIPAYLIKEELDYAAYKFDCNQRKIYGFQPTNRSKETIFGEPYEG